ncbi:MAG: major capsid protein, partial [Gammaproteobacteria bacterium]|nr:major capsid protein [Gammaproteobacteria bacterium]
MPNPTMNDVHTNALLSNVSIAYRNADYIADQIWPRIRVEKQSDSIAKYIKSDWFRINAQVWAPGAKKPTGEYRLDTADSYNCVSWALSHLVADSVVANADAPFRPRAEATEWLTDQIMLAYEYRVAAKVFSATEMSGYTAGVTALTGGAQVAWDTYETSDPMKDIDAMMALIRGQIAREPNVMVMGVQVWDKLKQHPDLLDRIKYTQTGIMTEGIFQSMIGIPKVLIGRSMYA